MSYALCDGPSKERLTHEATQAGRQFQLMIPHGMAEATRERCQDPWKLQRSLEKSLKAAVCPAEAARGCAALQRPLRRVCFPGVIRVPSRGRPLQTR